MKMHRFEIFTITKYRDLESRVKGHSRSLKMMPFNRSYYMTFF